MANEMIRTPREWNEACRECGGTGIVHKREHFSLWTPDEYMETIMAEHGPPTLGPRCKGASDVPPNAMICTVFGGASILEACREGVTLARAAGRPVAFEFNEAVAICRADSDPEKISKAWWRLAYGKTYEQSMAERYVCGDAVRRSNMRATRERTDER